MAAELTLIEAEIVDENSLPVLASTANRYHAEAESAVHNAVECAWQAGRALLEAKKQCKHGEWKPWLVANFHGAYRTAAVYMQLASNVQNSAHLESHGSIDGALKAISKRDGKPKPEPRPKPDGPTRTEQGLSLLCDSRHGRIVPAIVAEVIDGMTAPSQYAAGTLANAITRHWGSWAAFEKDRKAYNTESAEQQQRTTKAIYGK